MGRKNLSKLDEKEAMKIRIPDLALWLNNQLLQRQLMDMHNPHKFPMENPISLLHSVERAYQCLELESNKDLR